MENVDSLSSVAQISRNSKSFKFTILYIFFVEYVFVLVFDSLLLRRGSTRNERYPEVTRSNQ